MPALTKRRRWLNRRCRNGRLRPRPVVLRVVNAMSVSASPEKAARIWRNALTIEGRYGLPDVVNACEMADVIAYDEAVVTARKTGIRWHTVQHGSPGSPASALAIAVQDDRGTLSNGRLLAGSGATSEGGGIRSRPILRAHVHIDPGTPHAWTFTNATVHAPPPRAPRARRTFIKAASEVRALVLTGDLNLPRRIAARVLGRRVEGRGVIHAAVRRWIPTGRPATIDLGGDHLAIDLVLWP